MSLIWESPVHPSAGRIWRDPTDVTEGGTRLLVLRAAVTTYLPSANQQQVGRTYRYSGETLLRLRVRGAMEYARYTVGLTHLMIVRPEQRIMTLE